MDSKIYGVKIKQKEESILPESIEEIEESIWAIAQTHLSKPINSRTKEELRYQLYQYLQRLFEANILTANQARVYIYDYNDNFCVSCGRQIYYKPKSHSELEISIGELERINRCVLCDEED